MSICPKHAWGGVKAMLHSVFDQIDTDAVQHQYDKLLDNTTNLPEVHAHLDEHRAEARQGLERIVRDQPANLKAQLAYAELLTYDEASRRQGIERLAVLQEQSMPARQAWRQALLWLSPGQRDQALDVSDRQGRPGGDAHEMGQRQNVQEFVVAADLGGPFREELGKF